MSLQEHRGCFESPCIYIYVYIYIYIYIHVYISFILVRVMSTVLLCVAVNARSRLSDITVHTRSRLNDMNITEHNSVAFSTLKTIDQSRF